MGVFEGLKLSIALGYFKVEINVDSDMVVQAIKSGSSKHIGSVVMLEKIKTLMAKLDDVLIAHSVREMNKCADILASVGCNGDSEILLYPSPPVCISGFLAEDARGVSS